MKIYTYKKYKDLHIMARIFGFVCFVLCPILFPLMFLFESRKYIYRQMNGYYIECIELMRGDLS